MKTEKILSSNLYYDAFVGNSLPMEFVGVLIFRWLLGFIGFWLNMSLVWVTWRTKSLRESCNLLIAVNALFAALFGLSLSIGFVLVLSGHPFLRLMTCFQLQAFPLLCRNVGLNTLLFIGLDRLVCVLRPGWNRNTPVYFLCITVVSLAHALVIVGFSLEMALDSPKQPILCSTHDDVYQGPLTKPLFMLNVVVCLMVVLSYSTLWIMLKLRKSSATVYYTNRIIHSLMAMMVLLVAGFLMNNVMQILYLAFEFPDVARAYISVILSWLPSLAFASNAPILIGFSGEYRRAFESVFHVRLSSRNAQSSEVQYMTKLNTIITVMPKHFHQQQKVAPISH